MMIDGLARFMKWIYTKCLLLGNNTVEVSYMQ